MTEPDQPARVVVRVLNRCFPATEHVKFERNKSRLRREKKARQEKKTPQDHAAVLSLRHETLFFFSLATVEKCKINSRTKLDLVNILSKCTHIHSKQQYQHNLKGQSARRRLQLFATQGQNFARFYFFVFLFVVFI